MAKSSLTGFLPCQDSLSWSHMPTKEELKHSLFTGTILGTFYCQEIGIKSTAGLKVFTQGKSISETAKNFMPVISALMVFPLFLVAVFSTHAERKHLPSKKNRIKPPGNTASPLSSFFKDFTKGCNLLLI